MSLLKEILPSGNSLVSNPERHKKREPWHLLTELSSQSSLPWIIMGDFNDNGRAEEKRGDHPHPKWLMESLNKAIEESGLKEFDIEEHKFT
nr:endonuclease/exonuclease/phosphatase family protein [Ipomoea batatas]